jgi:Ca2+-binding EF-hand superfamily protein
LRGALDPTSTLILEKDMKYTLLTCGLLIAINAFANPGGRGDGHMLRALDADGDRSISLAEAQAGAPDLAAKFNEIDMNKDGMLSAEEMESGLPMRKVRITRSMQDDFRAADANTDGRLTRAEAEENMPIVSDFFAEMDGDSDGYVTQDEIHEHARKHGPIRVIRDRIEVKE